MLFCSDIPFVFSMMQAVGGPAHFLALEEWTGEDWVAFATTAPMVLARILIVFGIGLREGGQARKKD